MRLLFNQHNHSIAKKEGHKQMKITIVFAH